MGTTPIITLNHVSKSFFEARSTSLTALRDLSLEIFPGEIFVLIGPSGSGKSTLLRIMCGLEKSYEGHMQLGEGISQSDFSFVFQQFALLPWLTVSENIGLGLLARHVAKKIYHERIVEELKRFGLEKFAHAYPKELSGGMRQRVGIARALATDPRVVFMDEPFSELDSFTAEELRKELLHIWRSHQKEPGQAYGREQPTIVMVTHIIEEALELADRIAVLTPRPGNIEKVIVNKLPRPREKRSPEFFRLEDELYRLLKP